MNGINDLLDFNLDNLYRLVDFKSLLKNYQQIQNFTNKTTLGSPAEKYSRGLDLILPSPEYNSQNIFDALNFSDLIQYKSLQQSQYLPLSNWTPDVSVFTPEGIGTLEYSPWKNEPINKGTSTLDRAYRISYTYSDREYPLRGPSGTAFTEVDKFDSAFWMYITNTSAQATLGAIDILVPKSYFIACNFYDAYGLPSDVNVYTSSSLNITYTGLQFTAINPTYYDALDEVEFTIATYDETRYKITITPNSNCTLSPIYQCYLVCAGSDYVPATTRSSNPYTVLATYSYHFSALRFIRDIKKKTIGFPKIYDTKTLRTIFPENVTRIGLQGMSRGDLVALIGQNDSDENGIYAVDTGTWTKITDYIPTTYNFYKTQDFGFTGSTSLINIYGKYFDANKPDMKVLTYSSENLNPMWLMNSKPQGKVLSNISYSGSVYGDFKINAYNYDVDEINSIGSASVDYQYKNVDVQYDKLYFIPTQASCGKVSNLNNLAKGSIVNMQGHINNVSIGDIVYVYDNPDNFAIVEILFINNAGTIAQVIVQEVFGTISSSDLTLFNSGVIFSNFKVVSDYTYLPEQYQRQLFQSFLNFNNFPFTVFDIESPIIRSIVFQNDLTIDEIKALAVNPALYQLSSLEKGYTTDYQQFNAFEMFGFLKAVSSDGLEGIKLSPDVNYLSDDIEHRNHIYEYVQQNTNYKNTQAFISNSVTSQELAFQEYEFNFLDHESVHGETSTSYNAVAPYFTGPNLITTSTSYEDRVAIQDAYGNPYVISESVNNSSVENVRSIYYTIEDNQKSLGAAPRLSYEEFWGLYTGPYNDGLQISDSLYFHGNLFNPLKNVPSPLTKVELYKYQYSTGSFSEMIFHGQSLLIPLASTNYSSILKTCEIQAKVYGELLNHGFLRASVVDVTDFYATNNTDSIRVLAVSDKVVITNLTEEYSPVRFTFKDDSSYADRASYGQNIYLAIEKYGDFSPATIIVKCANQSRDQLYQYVSGSAIKTNLVYKPTVVSFTGSNIYNLYPYMGNKTVVENTINKNNVFSMQYVRYPYINNVTNKSYNSSSDYILVTLSGSVSGPGTTGPGNISLANAIGIGTYNFTMYDQFTGPTKQVIWGAPVSGLVQTPKGYHMLMSAQKSYSDALPESMIELEKDFVYNTMMIPETTLYFANNGLVGTDEGSAQDMSFITTSKTSVSDSINPVATSSFKSELRKGTLITPRLGYTGPVVIAGLANNKYIDFVFKKGTSQIYSREYVNFTPGMSYNVYQGSPNGIPDNQKDLEYISTGFIGLSQFNNTLFTGSDLINTNIYINFRAPSNYSNLKITSSSGALLKIQNITTNNHTGPWMGPTIELQEQLHSGSYYSIMATVFGVPAAQYGIIEYYDGAFRQFNINSGSIFTSVAYTNYLEHPDNLPLVDIKYVDSDSEEDAEFYIKRYVR